MKRITKTAKNYIKSNRFQKEEKAREPRKHLNIKSLIP